MRLLLVLVAASPLFGQCTYSVNPTQFSIAAGSGTGTVAGSAIAVTAGAGCTWGATTNTSWLHIDSGQTGSGSGTVAWHADANTVDAARTGSFSVAGQTVTVTQDAQTCSYTLTPQTMDFPVAGGTGSLQVQTSCTWQASSSAGFIQIAQSSQSSVTGNGNVSYAVTGNGCAAGRAGSIAVATGEQLAITQDGSASNFTFTPASESYSAALTNDRITISTGPGCNWTAFSDVSWLAITSGQSGTGNGAITIQVLANTSVARTGNLHINDGASVALLPVMQAAPVTPVQLNTVANGADYATNAVSPGEIVGLFGSNLGPATGVGLQVSPNGTSVATAVAGVQVMFDNIAAALTYVSANQVNAVVPYEVANNSNGQTNVQVVYQGMSSNTVAMPVAPSSPAIFTLASTGQGPGAILNQDLTVNSPNNRASRGSVVVIYCTGGGVTKPPSADASITPAAVLPYLSLPVAVTIGGQNAVVQYAGGTPDTVAGLTQINAVVPAGVTPGTNVPITVTIGGVISPSGVTLAVQ
jgi:uncharacterized protein (TIGR03437 family)